MQDWTEELLQEIVNRYENARRDDGAFPRAHIKAAMSEHRLWIIIQETKARLRSIHADGQAVPPT